MKRYHEERHIAMGNPSAQVVTITDEKTATLHGLPGQSAISAERKSVIAAHCRAGYHCST